MHARIHTTYLVTPGKALSTMKAEILSLVSPVAGLVTGVWAMTVKISAIPPLLILVERGGEGREGGKGGRGERRREERRGKGEEYGGESGERRDEGERRENGRREE